LNYVYADDCSIFLEPSEENLREVLHVLDSFKDISGLKISLSKTKAVWFGNGWNNRTKLCSDLNLDWASSFRLLGIDFTNNLENMSTNYDLKVKEIKTLFDNWMNRKLSIYGKIVVFKSLALSKLSHLSLVLPNLKKDQVKYLENIVFSFLWDGKPDKIARDHVRMSQKEGGLGVTDISAFWNSLKFSWLRRLLKTEAFWPQILTMETQRIIGNEIDTVGLMKLGPRMLHSIGKKFENQFWKEVFCTVEPIMRVRFIVTKKIYSYLSFVIIPL